ncbi:hypothetical protein [Streptomyces mobaraensis]|uniref:hypothetical protein n=1 Tax=Streptomyces mobaraensis TaxID=35621 RepID=UPI001F04A681|nr:hypothetical protein [Streptomyces mobaraensis]
MHSFGPGVLVHQIEQTSDVRQHAVRHRMEDGAPLSDVERLPDGLDRDVRAPLRAAGHPLEAVAALVASGPDPAAD